MSQREISNLEESKKDEPTSCDTIDFWELSATDAYNRMCEQLNKELGYEDNPPFLVAIGRIKKDLTMTPLERQRKRDEKTD